MATVAGAGIAGAELRPPRLRAWWLASRPRTLPVSLAPVALATAMAAADGRAAALPAAACVAVALLLQIGANLANDVFDFERGADTEERLGPARATQRGWLSPAAVRRGALAAFAAAALPGLYLAAVAGWPLLAVGAACIAAGLGYTAGPFPLAYRGLGECAVFACFGLVAVGGSYFVQAQALPASALVAGAALGAIASAILAVNNLRDVDTDARAGKRTLAVRFGVRFAVAEVACLLALPYALCAGLVASGAAPKGALLAFASLPAAARLARRVARERGPALNAVLAATARLELGLAALLAAGWLL